MVPYGRPRFDAWLESAYGVDGFWQHNEPQAHFRTASAAGLELAVAVATLVDRRPEVATVVEIGAGEGLLLAGLARLRPQMRLIGVDLRARPRYSWGRTHRAALRAGRGWGSFWWLLQDTVPAKTASR